jgi:hypothetical protein
LNDAAQQCGAEIISLVMQFKLANRLTRQGAVGLSSGLETGQDEKLEIRSCQESTEAATISQASIIIDNLVFTVNGVRSTDRVYEVKDSLTSYFS